MARIIVAGGGPAGCACAVTARRLGHDVVLMDDGRRLRSWPGESLPAGGGQLMESVFGRDVLSGSTPAYGTAAAWGSTELVAHDFMSHWSGQGWHLDRSMFDTAVREVALSLGVDAVSARVTSIGGDPGAWVVNGTWSAEWLVDATGRAGAIVARLGSEVTRCDDQIALVGVVADHGGQRITTVETVPDGWWYTSPLPDGRRVAALITDADLVTAGRREMWQESLAQTLHVALLVEDPADVDVSAYPAGTAYRTPMTGDHWLAVGDAAVSFDPLSSQGLITGVVMAARAAVAIEGDAVTEKDVTAWAADYRAVLDEHLAVRAEYAATETRWPESTFWSRRQTAKIPGASTAAR